MEPDYPDAFRCPISLELMSDPVILTSGHTFDRPSIQRWLDAGHRLCPVTNLPLPLRPNLIPNHALRSLISTFAPSAATAKPQPQTPSPDAAALAFLDDPARPDALSAALRLAQHDPAFRRLLADSGAAGPLLRLASDRRCPDLQDLSLRLLLHLTLDGDDARVGLVADGAVDPLAAALRHGAPAAALAATVLTSLSVVEVNKCTIGAHPAVIPSLTALLRDGSDRERREAATALYELSKFPDNRRRAVRAGAVPTLVELAASGSKRSVEVLGLLAKSREGMDQMRKVKNFVRILACVLQEGSPRGVEHALAVLNLVCSNDAEMALEARRVGIHKICFGFMASDNEKIVKNALGLAQTLDNGELGCFL